jgi:CHAT domain-containing protein
LHGSHAELIIRCPRMLLAVPRDIRGKGKTAMPSRIAGLRGRLPKKPPAERLNIRYLSAYLTSPLPSPAYPIDVTSGITDWGMLGNGPDPTATLHPSGVGNCTFAGQQHYRMAKAAAAGENEIFESSNDLVREYLKYDHGKDEGASIADLLLHQYKAGKILAFAPIDHTNPAEVDAAMAAFHGVYVGVNLTDDADQLFGQGQPWTVANGQQPDPNEGHCILKVKADGSQLDGWVTWGTVQESTLAWTMACVDEAWVILTEEDAAAANIDIAALRADIDALHGTGGEVERRTAARTVPRDAGPTAQRDGDGFPGSRPRYLKGRCPETVPVGKPFSVLASIVLSAPAARNHASVGLKHFDVPAEGRDVLLVVDAPGLRLLGDQRLSVRVPAAGDSDPVMFELRADAPGTRSVSITAWVGGSYLGELLIEVSAGHDAAPGPHREVRAEIANEFAEGAVCLVARYDPVHNAYRFEFRDDDNPDEVQASLAYAPGPLVEQLLADLDDLAKGRSGYSAAQARDYLMNAGARLWRQLIPAQLREQFWDRQHRIRQLNILSDKDSVPWELLYPMDLGHDAGFLVEQFPVTRGIFKWRPTRTLRLQPARFVLPEGSPPAAREEIDAMRQLLDPVQLPSEVISALAPLTDLIVSGNFGLLHFACHNTYDSARGSSIRLGKLQLTATGLERAVIQKVLKESGPTVFINACRSAGLAASYNQLEGWASVFLEAGAAAFIGSLWAVSDGAAREFACELYGQLRVGTTLGEAVMRARQVAARQADDPTWLAYTVYGDPRATINRQP